MTLLRGFILALCLTGIMAVPTDQTERAVQEVSQGANQFSNAFYHAVAQEKPGNLITSPLSASVVLSMAAYGARENTQAQMKSVLHLPEESVGRTGFPVLIDALNSVKNVNLKLANKVFISQTFSVKPEFQQLTESAFRSASEKVNFADKATAANTINTWTEDQTNHRIKDLIKADELDPLTAMILVNAVYFKGNWKEQFKVADTTDRPFHVDANTVKNVPTMYKKDSLRYGEIPDMNASFVELPYEGNEVSMVIILPNEINGLAQVEEKLQNADLSEILSRGYKRDVKLYLPKFKIESTIQLNEVLKKMGMTEMFTDHANFHGITDSDIAVSKVVQKAFIEVNEEGSEAAAATGVVAAPASAPIEVEMKVDHPFFYSIVKTSEGQRARGSSSVVVPMFTGHVQNLL